MRGARGVVVAVVALACLLGGCGRDDGMLDRLQADPVWTLDVPGTTERAVTSREGGTTLGKRSVARAARTLVPDDPADLDRVRETVVAAAEDAGWADPEVLPDSGSVTYSRTVDGVVCTLYVAVEGDGVRVSLTAS